MTGVAPVVVLVGAPGSGKSTVGRALAERLGVDFRDTDADVEAEAGVPISEQFVTEGERAFRARERTAVARALQEHDGVLALGGGAVLDGATRERLRGQRVCWLAVSATVAGARVGLGAGRPLLLGNVRSKLVTLLRERTPLYEEVADVTVSTDQGSVQEVVDAVVAALAEQDAP